MIATVRQERPRGFGAAAGLVGLLGAAGRGFDEMAAPREVVPGPQVVAAGARARRAWRKGKARTCPHRPRPVPRLTWVMPKGELCCPECWRVPQVGADPCLACGADGARVELVSVSRFLLVAAASCDGCALTVEISDGG